MKLRPYQETIIKDIKQSFKKGHKKILVTAPTGSGKTIISKYIVDGAKNTVLFTAPRRNLIIQTAETFGIDRCSIVMGSDKRFDFNKRVQVGTLQTLKNRNIPEPKIIILDEVHIGYGASMVSNILEKYPKAFIIGLSATPINEKGYLLEGFDDIVESVQTEDLIKQKYLTPTVDFAGLVKPELKNVKLTAGDYNLKELSEQMQPATKEIVQKWLLHGQYRQTLCFAVDIAHGELLKKEFESKKVSVSIIHSKKENSTEIDEFKRGKTKVLINVEMLTTGSDIPEIECLLFARPTKSLRLWIQMIGRGLRLHEGKKECIVLDCAGNIEEHGESTKRHNFIFKPKFSEKMDRQLGLDEKVEASKQEPERAEYFRKITKLVDLYDGKVYLKESELQEDVNKFLRKASFFWWRQNSGMAYMNGRWVHFTDKKGLPDNTLIFKGIYIGLELKLPSGYLTKHQKETLPEMLQRKVLVFIVQSIGDLFRIIEHLEKHIKKIDNGTLISDNVYCYPEWQQNYLRKLKLLKYMEV